MERTCMKLERIRWMHMEVLLRVTDFKVSERLHRGPEFSQNYLIDFTIGFVID